MDIDQRDVLQIKLKNLEEDLEELRKK